MGSGLCSRRQRRIFQCLLLVSVVCGMMYGGMISYEMHKRLKRTEAMALKYQQHQESLSAQLQVVYEHRSRLEKSLQKERLEHKKAKEDYLVFKLDAQQSLNKEKQDASSRFTSLQVQHQMLKNQHEDLKKQFYDLQEQHHVQGEDHNRLLDEHKEHYGKMQQAKDLEISHLKDNVYNLREENKQLRKAHHDIHTQLQDAQVQHQTLKITHNQLKLTLEDHKSALAVAQVQVDEYKRLRESLSSNRHPEQNLSPQHPQVASITPEFHVHVAQQATKLEQPNKEELTHEDHLQDTESRLDHQEDDILTQPVIKFHPTISQHTLSDKEEDREGEAERRRELAEEEMAQAGQPQNLEEDPDQLQDDQQEEDEPKQEELDENFLDQRRHLGAELHHDRQLQHEAVTQAERAKSAYEQQRMEAQRAEVHMQQEALQVHKDTMLKERGQRLKQELEREQQQRKDASRQEQLLSDKHQRKRTDYENIDNDTVQGEEDHHTDNEEDAHMLHKEEENQLDHRVPPHEQRAVFGEPNPDDDPNNQGEDEFEEAEDERLQHRVAEEEEAVEEEPVAPAQHKGAQLGHEHPAVDEELVMAGNPDQQEDTLDDQYQEEVEDEAQEDVVGGQKREEEVEEEEGEDSYNEENIEQDQVKHQEGPRQERDHRKEAENNEEENYKEEEEDHEENMASRDKGTNKRAEM